MYRTNRTNRALKPGRVAKIFTAALLAMTGGCAVQHSAASRSGAAAAAATEPSTRPVDIAHMPLSQIAPMPVMPVPAASDDEATSQPPVESLMLFLKARDALRDGRRFSAITLLQRAIDLDPHSFELYMTLAQARQNPGSPDPKVIEALEKAVAIRPDDLRAQAALGRQYLASGDLDQAILHLRLARRTTQYRDHADQAAAVDLFLARSLQQKGYAQAAVEVYADLLRRLENPDIDIRGNPQLMMLAGRPSVLYVEQARLNEQLGHDAAALNDYEAAARHDPGDFDLNARVVTLLGDTNHHDQAMARALEMVSRFGGSADSIKLLDRAYAAAGKANQAAIDLQRLSAEHPNDRGLTLALAQSLTDHGDAAAARTILINAVKQAPDDRLLLKHLFDSYAKSGQTTQAAMLLIDYSATHPAMQEEIDPLWRHLTRPEQKNRLTSESLQKVEVAQAREGAKLFWVARLADMELRTARATRTLQKAVELSPPFAPAVRSLLNGYWARDDWSDARKTKAAQELAALMKQHGAPALAAEVLGLDLLRANHVPQAAAALQQAIKLGDDNPDVRLAHAQTILRQGKTSEYEQLLGNLTRDHPLDDDAWQSLFQFYFQRGQPSRGIAVLGEWLKANPQSPQGRLIKAGVALRADQPDQAEKLLLDLSRHPDRNPVALAMLRQLYGSQGTPQKYLDLLEQLRAQRPVDTLVLGQIVDVQINAGKPADALPALDNARKIAADDPVSLYLLAHLYQQIGQDATSDQVLLQALKLDPDYPPANNDLGYTWAEAGKNLPQAEQMVRLALKEDPDNTSYLDSLGWVLYKLGRFDEARTELQRAAVGPSPDPVILNHLGDTLYRLSLKDQAEKSWRRSLQEIKNISDPRDELVKLRPLLERKLLQLRGGQPPAVAPSLADEATRT